METLTQITNYLASQSWQIALLSVAVAAVSLLLKNRSSHVRYLLWLVVLAKCLVPSLFTITLAVLPQPMSTEDAPPAATTPVFEVPEIESAVLEPAVFRAPALSESELAPIYSTSTPVPPVSEPTVTDKLAKVSARQWLALGWAAGAVLFMAVVSIKALRTNLWLKARRRPLPAKLQGPIADFFAELGVRRAPKVWMVAGIGQPFVWGLLRGAIYLPTDFKSNARRSHRQVLAHELSHVLRFDAVVNLLQIIAQAFYWFHPFVWWANRKIRAEREKSCDETAIARLNALPKDYSRAIVNILVTEHNSARPVPSLAIAGPIRNIEDRIRTIMRSGKRFYCRPTLVTIASIVLLAAIIVPTTLALTTREIRKPNAGSELEKPETEIITRPCVSFQHVDRVDSVLFSGDSRTLISESFEDDVKVTEALTASAIGKLDLRGYSANSITLSHDGTILAMGTNTGKVQLWHMELLRLQKTFPVTKWSIYAVALSPDGKTLASCAADGTVQLWDIKNSTLLKSLGKKGAYRMSSMAFSPDSSMLATLSRDGRADLWDVDNGRLTATIVTNADAWGQCSISFCPDGNTIAIATPGLVQFWSPKNNNQVQRVEPPDSVNPRKALKRIMSPGDSGPHFVGMIVLSTDCKTAAIVIEDGSIVIWHVQTRTIQHKLIGSRIRDLPGGGVEAMSFSRDKKLFASGKRNGKVEIWRLAEDGKDIEKLEPAETVGESKSLNVQQLNAREVLEKFIEAAVSGDDQRAARYANGETIEVFLKEFVKVSKKQEFRVNFITADSAEAVALSCRVEVEGASANRFVFRMRKEADRWRIVNAGLKSDQEPGLGVQEFVAAHPKSRMIPEDFKGSVELDPVLREERDKVLGQIDAEIRNGIIGLSKKFPQLTKSNGWNRFLSNSSVPDRIGIHLRHSYGTKSGNSPDPVPENDRYSVLVIVKPPPPQPEQLEMSTLYPNLRLVGQVGARAGNPELDAALKKLVADSLSPLKQLNEKAGGRGASVGGVSWGEAVAGLRCRWVTPAKKVQAGSAVVIGMEVENISGGRIFWQCRQGTWNICTPGSEPKDGSSTAPQFQIRPADGLRAATDEEAQMHHEGAGSAIGYYCLEPGARMTITAPYLWPLVESGRVEVNAFLWRVNPGGGGAYPMDHVHKNQMTCPPLVLEVVGGVDRQIIEGLSVWVSCDEARVEFAEDLKFTVRVENKSGREVELDSCGPAEDFPDLTLRMDSQESGRHILSTKKAGGRGPRRARRTIKNNVKKVREIRLSQLWRGYGGRPILSPGRYRVIANVGALTEQGGQIEVASAPIWVTISQWPWGKQVNGLQCSAVPEKVMWEAGETPTLEAKVRNVGSSPWSLPSLLELFYLKTGGKLWHWRPDVSAELVNLEPGEGLEKTIRVTEDWVCSDDPNLRLKLSPGRHTIQFVILVAEPTEANVPPGTSQMPRPLTIESNPIQIEILPAEREAKEADEVDWGQAVEGVQCRLRPDRDSWRAGETATLKADIRNRGTHQLSVVQHQGLCELWFDGRWYRWEGEIRAKSSPLGPGRQYNDVPISLDEHWVANRNGKPLRPRRRHTVRVAFITDSKQGEVIRVHSNPVLIEILPPRPGSGSSSRGAEREAEARRAVAEGSRRRISYIGLDLTDAPRTSNRADLADLFEERPRGSGTYLLRDEVVAARHPEFWEEGVVYYVAEKKQFYIIEEPGHPGSGSKTFYGPFAGEPWKRFGMAEPRPVKKQYRFAIYLVVDPIDVGHPEDVTLEQLRLGSVPALTEEDIVEYDWNEHFLKLTPEAWKRVPSPRSVWGLPFVVVADGQRCYLGAFSSFGSSYMPKVPFIGGFRPGWRENKIQISHPDPIAGAKDPRNDLRIRKVLEELKIVGATKERLKSADKLKGLGLALLMFANDHQGNYPDALQELAQKDYIDEQDLKWFLENVEYLGKATTGAGASGKVIAYDRMLLKRKHGSFTNVLLLDGHVALKDSEQLYKLGIWCFVIPDEVKAVMLQFVEAVQEAFWEQAYPGKEDLLWERVLVNCSERVKAKAKEYESARAFFRDVVPLRAVAESRELRFFPDKGSSDRFYYVSNWFFRTSDPNMEHRTGWQPSILKTEAGWIIDFRTTPLKEWIERYKEQAIRARLSEDEREAKWHAFEWKLKRVKARTRLVPVSREFVIGRPMLFRLELINEGEEEFLYDHQQIAVNRSLTITNESGERMPYITGPVQTWPADGYKRIKPGESVVLFDSLDIANEYDIRKVGKYKVQFNGRGLHTAINIGEGEKAPFDNDNILGLRRTFPSNIVETEVTFLERDRKKKSTIGQDASVSKQLEQVVDLSVLRPDMTFAEALGHLKNSVKPPLVIVVLWRDVEDNADLHRTTPINMDPISAVQLGAALELLLRSVSGREAELDYVVNNGVIVIATKESLPRKMETRVYDISALIGVRSKGGYRRQYYGTGQSYGGGSLGYMAGEYVHLPGGWGAMRRSDFNKLSNVHRAGELPADMPSRYVSLTFTPSVKQDSGDISLALTVAFDKVVGHKNYVIETPLPGGAVAEQKQGLPRTKEIWRLRTCQTVPEGKILLVKGREFETQNKAGEVITKDLFILIEPEELDPIRTEELFC